jgi:hypothetical protein
LDEDKQAGSKLGFGLPAGGQIDNASTRELRGFKERAMRYLMLVEWMLVMTVPAQAATAEELAGQIHVGDRKQLVEKLVAREPESRTLTRVLGLAKEEASWALGEQTLVVVFVHGRAVAVSINPRPKSSRFPF